MSTTVNIAIPQGPKLELKQLEILDINMNTIYSDWLRSREHVAQLTEGLYSIRVVNLQGETNQQTIEVKAQQLLSVDLDQDMPDNKNKTSDFPDDIDGSIFSGKVLSDSMGYIKNYYTSDHIFRKIFEKDIFTFQFPKQGLSEKLFINTQGRSYPRLAVELRTHYYLISLPVNEEVMVSANKIVLEGGRKEKPYAHEVQFSVRPRSVEVDGLLRLLATGDILRAKSLFDHVGLAKQLLYNKIENPSYAALGGYFLLRSNALEEMHHWPENLANWFEWLPDGCIIHATQQMRHKDTDKDILRHYLLMAYRRGIPQFTEGLRLLHEGLMRLSWIGKGDDHEINEAYETVGRWIARADFSSGFTIIKENYY